MAATDEAEKRVANTPGAGDYVRPFVPTAVTMVGVVAILYLGREVFLPLAIAFLLTFALAPIVSALRKRSIPKVPAVVVTVTLAFLAIGLFSFVVATQVSTLAQNIPTYQSNILEKVRALREVGANGGIVERLSNAVERVGAELQRGTRVPEQAEPQEPAREPLPVEIVSRQNPVEILKNVIVPLAAPFATAGLIIVVVIFMLLEREDLRDRFIRLVGYSDLHRTTEALQDAGKRVGRYLLMQLVVNTTYAIPITVGLWLIGIPNALLWGLLALVLRFVPYIGPAIAMLLPMLLALAVAPGWSMVLWTAGLFLVMELISNNIVEPWLYGSRTGLSSLAIIVAAIFWTWLWGPLGLVISTPLTVCLVVLGRHVPQFAFLDVMLGNEPVLEPHARLYQRLLAGDPDEATDYAEEFLEERYLVDYYDHIGIPALLIGENDRQRGVMTDEQRRKLADSALALVENLEDIAQEEEEEEEEAAPESGKGPTPSGEDGIETPDLPDGEGRSLLCLGGRGELDDAAAAMLAQVLEVQGAEVVTADHAVLEGRAISSLPLAKVDTVVVAFLNAASLAHARHAVRRLKRARPGLRVGILMPRAEGEKSIEAASISADFVAGSIAEAVKEGLDDKPAVKLKATTARLTRRKTRPNKPAAATA
ncbi:MULTISPECIES: AI-2E family transporter [Pseudomonadota]|uniref:ABC transporter permease n=1 Tax=Aquamicrobium defluvii TaxID=69279 RepID=A0A011TIA7_9HYPH|nr:ABC transporter permease [Aquamicrobium defluvii]EZQ15167.1 ABC transporter permease [Halopseudomonas bauzanensis]